MHDPCRHAGICTREGKKRNRVLPRDLYVALLRILHVFVLSRMTNIIIQI